MMPGMNIRLMNQKDSSKEFIFVLFQSGVSLSVYGTFMLFPFLSFLARYNFLQFVFFYCYQQQLE